MEIRKKKKEKYANFGFHAKRKIITGKSMGVYILPCRFYKSK